MLTQQAIAHFGTKAALARALGIKRQAITTWGKTVPLLRALQLEKITEGKLKAPPVVRAA